MASPYTYICMKCGELVRCSTVVDDIICPSCALDELPEMTLEEYEKLHGGVKSDD